jgi:hypothetical protein
LSEEKLKEREKVCVEFLPPVKVTLPVNNNKVA